MTPIQSDQLAAVGAKSGPRGPSQDLQGPQKGRFGPKQALLGPLRAQGRPNTRAKCMVTMTPTQSDQLAAVGAKSGPRGPSKDLQGPQKGHFGPKRALLGPLGAQGRPNTGAKCVVTITPTQSDQLAAVWTKSGPRGPFKTLGDPQKGLSGPKRALLGPLGAQMRPNTRPKCVVTMTPTQSDQLGAVGTKSGPRGPSKTLGDPQKGLSGPKRALLGPFWGPLGPREGLISGQSVW